MSEGGSQARVTNLVDTITAEREDGADGTDDKREAPRDSGLVVV